MKDFRETKIKNIIEETTKFDFPIFSDEQKKKNIICEKKKHIEKLFEKISPELM